MEQLLCHLIGDYVLQSYWMAHNKSKSWWAAYVHSSVYTLSFMLIASAWACLAILLSHLLIDRLGVVRWVVYAQNFLGPRSQWRSWSECKGADLYHPTTPVWIAGWLLILVDNTIHLCINYCAIKWL